MRSLLLSSCLLAMTQCAYPVAPQGSYPTPPPSDSYVIPKQSYPVPPAQYAHKFNSAPVPPPHPPPAPAQDAAVHAPPPSSGYSDNDVTVSVQSAPPAPLTDAQLASFAPATPTFGGSLSSSKIAGGSALTYSTGADSAVSSSASETASNYRRRAAKAKAKARARARARARAPTVNKNRRALRRRPLQPIRRFHKKAKH